MNINPEIPEIIDNDVEILGEMTSEFSEILTSEAIEFIKQLENKFGSHIDDLLSKRQESQQKLVNGEKLHFLPETKSIRDGDWKVAPIPADLQDRRVEITGPAERKMIINALNSGARVFMADIEDSLSPSWDNIINAQIDLRDAVNRTIEFTNDRGKHYKLNDENIAVLIVRPRGLHLLEKHIKVNGKTAHGSLVDFGLYFFHNVKRTLEIGSGPYFYLPKLEHHEEAKLWNDVFVFAQDYVGISQGTIKATVLIETINAAFQMDEILFALKDHIVAQNAGRWDYIFSFIKKHSSKADFVCPERGQVVMTQHFLRSYSKLLIQTCHKRGAMAMGGMSAFIPIKNDEFANDKAIGMVRKDKEREAGDGHDGTWVAHPALIPVAMEVFDRIMPSANQIEKTLDDITISEGDLLAVPEGNITVDGIRNNISVGIQYTAAWLNGNGCVPIFNLMEDAATAEISRTQLWQWIYHKAETEAGVVVTKELYKSLQEEELEKIKQAVGEDNYKAGKFKEAAELFDSLILKTTLDDFLTHSAYEMI